MTSDLAIYLCKQMLFQAVKVTGPIIAVALIVGLIISIFQVATQIQDPTISFVPKIMAVVFTLFLLGHWMITSLTHFTKTLILSIPGSL